MNFTVISHRAQEAVVSMRRRKAQQGAGSLSRVKGEPLAAMRPSGPLLVAMSGDKQGLVHSEKASQWPPDGPQTLLAMCAPPSPPPEEISPAPKPRRGFALHPEHRYRPGRPKHNNFRLAPKEPGWRLYHPRALLSAADVMAIRASPLPATDQAKFYGVGTGTIRDIRAGRRGRLWRARHSAGDNLEPDQLATQLMKEIVTLTKRYRAAMRRSTAR
jgi:hypothetical protein